MSAFDNVRSTYEKFGADDPFYAVLSTPEFRSDVLNKDSFYETGRQEISRQMQLIGESGIEVARSRALDFGCGVGRLSNALATSFNEVVGVDISSTMVKEARQNCHTENCSFIQNTNQDLSIFPDGHFDFVYSSITLQHIPMPASGQYLADFLRVLKKDGLIICLVPDGRWSAPGSIQERATRLYRNHLRPLLKTLRGKPAVQIHPIANRSMKEIIVSAGGQIVHTEVTPEYRESRRQYKPTYYWIRHVEAVGDCSLDQTTKSSQDLISSRAA